MTWKIQAITSELTGQEIGIDRDMVVGRHQSADIVLQAAEISRKHAAFLLKDQALWVQDLNSSNGSFVNDLRIEHETLLKEGDIVQFASLKFSVLAPAQEVVAVTIESAEVEAEPVQPEVIPATEQPSEAVAVSETEAAQVEEASKTAAQQMNEQGMPSLTERDREVQVSRDGMPQQVAIPKPAPIPAGVDVQAVPEPQPIAIEQPVSRVEQVKQEQKNASIGLISIIALIILAIIAWLLFK
ncbi:FHA domain-containing protein [Acinetobacter bohemicus]|uniref:FHA domain-containing protein n=1 Tax=Acinetobacter bohemicus TaxID=1435036 RepID=UPI0040410226